MELYKQVGMGLKEGRMKAWVLVGLVVPLFGIDISDCKGCHGQHFEKRALNASKIVSQMSEVEIATALNGYKDGTYGRGMKGIMKAQLRSVEDKSMDRLVSEVLRASKHADIPDSQVHKNLIGSSIHIEL
jgi:cytochrome c-type protein NapB